MEEKLNIHVVGTEDTIIGFGLVGISGTVINSAEEAEQLLAKLAESKEYAIIIINRKYLEGIEEFIKNYRLDPDNPIIVDIPDESGIITYESVKDIIKKSIGI